MTSIKL